jgi:hypothetical protein
MGRQMRPDELQSVRRLLEKLDIGHYVRDIQPAGAKGKRSVWSARIVSQTVTMPVQLVVYSLSRDPSLIVDYGEEKTLLESLPSADAGWQSAPGLVAAIRDAEVALLVTGSAADVLLLDEERKARAAGDPVWRYDRGLERVVGGDYFRQVNGVWVRGCVMPVERGQRLVELLERVIEVHGASAVANAPRYLLPEPAALLQLDQAPPKNAPPQYAHLGLLAVCISANDQVNRLPSDTPRANRVRAAGHLLGVVAAAHQAGTTLTDGNNNCIDPARVTGLGGLLDIYYLSDSPAAAEVRRRAFQEDVTCALGVALYGLRSLADCRVVLGRAVDAYVGAAAAVQCADEIQRTAEQLSRTGTAVQDPLRVLAAQLTARR